MEIVLRYASEIIVAGQRQGEKKPQTSMPYPAPENNKPGLNIESPAMTAPARKLCCLS
jgi:hypothetical protein